jgi:oxaloacetate decarboxylase beta subunit
MDFSSFFPALASLTWQHLIMIAVGAVLIYLAIARQYEPTLLLPMGFGAILVNIPFSAALTQIDGKTGEVVEGVLSLFYEGGIATEIFPLLIFIAIRRHDRFYAFLIILIYCSLERLAHSGSF